MELEAKLAALTASGAGKPTGSSPPASAAKSKGQVPKVANKSGKTGGAPKAKSKKHVPPPPSQMKMMKTIVGMKRMKKGLMRILVHQRVQRWGGSAAYVSGSRLDG